MILRDRRGERQGGGRMWRCCRETGLSISTDLVLHFGGEECTMAENLWEA